MDLGIAQPLLSFLRRWSAFSGISHERNHTVEAVFWFLWLGVVIWGLERLILPGVGGTFPRRTCRGLVSQSRARDRVGSGRCGKGL